MTFKEVVTYLVEKKYIVLLGGEPTMTLDFADKFKKEAPTIKVKMDQEQIKSVWDQFVGSAQIPHRAKTESSTYTIKQYTPEAAKKLWEIWQTLTLEDYTLLIEATRLYYKSVSYPVTLNNYLRNNLWEMELEEYKKKKKTGIVVTGTNRFES